MTAAEIDRDEAPAASPATILSLNNIEVVYDRVILVLKGVSLEVTRGGIVALLGANGAGKTTTLKAISNLLHAERGEVTKGAILFDGQEVQALSPNELVRRGCIPGIEGGRRFGPPTIRGDLLSRAPPPPGGARPDRARPPAAPPSDPPPLPLHHALPIYPQPAARRARRGDEGRDPVRRPGSAGALPERAGAAGLHPGHGGAALLRPPHDRGESADRRHRGG